MPDLTHAAAVRWLHARDADAAALARPGPVDAHAPALAALLHLGSLLDEAAECSPAALSAALRQPEVGARLRQTLPQIGMARRLRLLEWFDDAGLPGHEAIVATMGDGPDGAFQRAELTALERRAILARIFSPERVAELRTACGEAGS